VFAFPNQSDPTLELVKRVRPMNATHRKLSWFLCCAAPILALVHVGSEAGAQKADADKGQVKKIEVGKNVWLETEGDKRRVVVNAVVCNRDCSWLEHLLCRRLTKEHEAILAADVDAANIHLALLLAGAEPGSPIKFVPKFRPAHGTVIKVFVQYQHKGQTVTVPAQKWVRYIKTQTELRSDWVFAGSRLVRLSSKPLGPAYYTANDGDVFCVANFETALLDLPFASSSSGDELLFETFTERIPPEGTAILVILEPVLPPKTKSAPRRRV
jgi:hypothetical protein